MDKWNYKNRPLSLYELTQLAEEALDENLPNHVYILPPENACEENTDEDSGEEDNMEVENLPGSQLRAEVEVLLEIPSSDYDSEDELPIAQLKRKCLRKKKKSLNWIDEDLPQNESNWKAVHLAVNNITPLDIFRYFFDDKLFEYIVEETNRYANQKNKNGDVTIAEMKCFFGILLLSGYTPVPRRKMYWENASDCCNELVRNAISRDRFSHIMTHIHFADNNALDKSDKFSKLRPLISELNNRFQEFAPIEEYHSVDEAMVPYFGRHGTKQFIRGKPIRWGYKLWAGTTRLGYIVWFSPYQGSSAALNDKYKDMGLGASIVLSYADVLLSLGYKLPYHIVFDNFFTSVPLLKEISNKMMKGTGTMRENRTSKCPLIDSSELKKLPRGSFDYKQEREENILICKWNDNSIVHVATNYASVHPIRQVSRYSQKEKKRIPIQQPNIIRVYNENMGGVDRSDQNISLYRTAIRGKKWYFPIFAHCLDMAIQNSWQLYRKNSGKKDHLAFRRSIATALLETNKKSKRGPSKLSTSLHEISRYDRLDHLPTFQEKQTRCRLCHTIILRNNFINYYR